MSSLTSMSRFAVSMQIGLDLHHRLNPVPVPVVFGCFHKLGVLFVGVLILKVIVYWGVFWAPPFLETPILRRSLLG